MQTINQFVVGETVIGFFMVKSYSIKSTASKSTYLDLNLSDKTGEINGKLWDAADDLVAIFENQQNPIVKVKGVVTEWQGKLQLKIEKLRSVSAADELDPADFVATAPFEPEQMYGKIVQYISSIEQQDIYKIVNAVITESRDKLLYYPAAQKNHHAVRSGLLYHMLTMLRTGEALSAIYTHINRDLLYAGIIIHDIGKLEEMASNDLGIVSDYTVEGHLLGHIIQGIKQIERIAQQVGADSEVSLLLQHMILSHHSIPEFGSPKPPMIPEAELLHYIDMIDSRMYDMDKALSTVVAGDFSERVWSLNNRKIYKYIDKSQT